MDKTRAKVKGAVQEIAKDLVKALCGPSGAEGLPVRQRYGVAEGV